MTGMLRAREGLALPEALAARVSYRIRLLQIAAWKSFEKVVTDHGSAPRYFGMLKIVEANPGISQARLAEAIFLDRSSLVPILETLTAEGWIERRAAEGDRRVRRVYLTAEGQVKLTALEVEVDRHEAALTRGLDPKELDQLNALLDRLDANLRAGFAAQAGKAP